MPVLELARGRIKARFRLSVANAVVYAILAGIVFLIYYPIISNISDMLKSSNDLIDSSVAFIPREPSLTRLFQTIAEMHYGEAFINTFALSLAVALIQTAVCTLTGYGFARYFFPLKKMLFASVILTMILPIQLLLPSYYLRFVRFDIFGIFQLVGGQPLDLVNQPLPILLLSLFGIGFKNGLFIFLTRQFFINLPRELDESAKIDGAGHLRIFGRIMLPNAVPILISVFLFGFSWQWTDQYTTSMFMMGKRFFGVVLPAMITPAHFKGYNDMEIAALITTGVLLILAPLMLLYIFLQRFFVQGIERSGLVG